MPDPAGSTRIDYEVGNALGAVWQVMPRLAAKLTRCHNYAKAVQTYLRAVDFYCDQHGITPARIRIDTTLERDRLVQRISG
jgi:hypothetical protein